MSERAPFVVAGLFAGVGGIELGLRRAGHEAALLCEFDAGASAVLQHHFSGVRLHGDARTLSSLPSEVDLLSAGFPCQDSSQAGQTKGIAGARSGLVREVFRLLLRLTEPAPGLLHAFAMEMGGQVLVPLRVFLYGDTATATAERAEPIWQGWLSGQFAPPG